MNTSRLTPLLRHRNSPTRQLLGALAVATLLGPLGTASHGASLAGVGVNLAGAEFQVQDWGVDNVPGTYGTDYIYPNTTEIDYYVGKGVNVFRLPFAWERLQPTLNGDFDSTELGRLNTVVNYATGKGASVLLDPHNYGRYSANAPDQYSANVVGLDVPASGFANLWSRLATEYKSNSKVVFGLMNEPHDMPSTANWVTSANLALSAIRTAGAANLVTVPGNYFTGAHNWTTTDNATQMLNVVDPGNNYVFEVHQYFDSDYSGTSATIANNDPNIGVETLTDITEWLIAHDRKAFLGEFAVANSTIGAGSSQIGDEVINNMIGYMEQNSEVWTGFTWWAGGPMWGDYIFTIEPTGLGTSSVTDQASMDLLEPYFISSDSSEYALRTDRWLSSGVPVPEPSTWALLLMGTACSVWALRRRH